MSQEGHISSEFAGGQLVLILDRASESTRCNMHSLANTGIVGAEAQTFESILRRAVQNSCVTHEEVDGGEAKEDEEAAPDTDGEGAGAGEAAEEGSLPKEEAGKARPSRAPAAAPKGRQSIECAFSI